MHRGSYFLKQQQWGTAGEMAQWLEALVIKPDNLALISESHKV